MGVGPRRLDLATYEHEIAEVSGFGECGGSARISVVVVAYRSGQKLACCLDSLRVQSFPSFEVIVVDNGGSETVGGGDSARDYVYVEMKHNVGCSAAKNVGALIATGDIVCFLDDDAVAHPEFVAAHWAAYERAGIAGLRGRVLPKTPGNVLNGLATHYDLGDRVIPAYIDAETNASFVRQVFLDAGGFASPVLRGDNEGVELSRRIVRRLGDPSALMYYPGAIVYHDFADSLPQLLRKVVSQTRARAAVGPELDDFWSFVGQYDLPQGILHAPTGLWARVRLAVVRRLVRVVRCASSRWFAAERRFRQANVEGE